jgi:hypothetical protein
MARLKSRDSEVDTQKDSLGHVNTPDACATTQIQDPWAFLVEKGGAVKSTVASNEEDLMEDVQSLQLILDGRSASALGKGGRNRWAIAPRRWETYTFPS